MRTELDISGTGEVDCIILSWGGLWPQLGCTQREITFSLIWRHRWVHTCASRWNARWPPGAGGCLADAPMRPLAARQDRHPQPHSRAQCGERTLSESQLRHSREEAKRGGGASPFPWLWVGSCPASALHGQHPHRCLTLPAPRGCFRRWEGGRSQSSPPATALSAPRSLDAPGLWGMHVNLKLGEGLVGVTSYGTALTGSQLGHWFCDLWGSPPPKGRVTPVVDPCSFSRMCASDLDLGEFLPGCGMVLSCSVVSDSLQLHGC